MKQHLEGGEGPKEAPSLANIERYCRMVLLSEFIFKSKDTGLGGQSLLPAPSRGTQKGLTFA